MLTFKVTTVGSSADFERQMTLAENMLREDRDILRALAKKPWRRGI